MSFADLVAPMNSAIEHAATADGRMVLRSLAIVDLMDEDGGVSTEMFTSNGLRVSDTLGLIAFAHEWALMVMRDNSR